MFLLVTRVLDWLNDHIDLKKYLYPDKQVNIVFKN